MLIHHTEGKARETRRLMRVVLAVVAALLTAFTLVHMAVEDTWMPLVILLTPIALGVAAAEIRTHRVLARAGRPALDFSDRVFFYWRKKEEPPEEISYAEILTYYSTLLNDGDGDTEVFVTIEFRQRRRIRLRSSYLDIGPRQLLALVERKLKAALP